MNTRSARVGYKIYSKSLLRFFTVCQIVYLNSGEGFKTRSKGCKETDRKLGEGILAEDMITALSQLVFNFSTLIVSSTSAQN